MTSQERNLSAEQTELVAVGASVGAGCQPCVSHHLKAGARAGLEGDQLLAAVASAERVGAEAAVAMGDHVRSKLGPDVSSPALLSRLEEALASLGAALGANDKANIERQLRAAAELGASRSQLRQAIDAAHTVQENAARIHRREAERLLDAVAPATAAAQTGADSGGGCGGGADAETHEAAVRGDGAGEGCGCGADDSTEEAPVTAGNAAATTGDHAAGCGGTAAPFAARSASRGMAGCHELFERFRSAAPAETDDAPPATTATGACHKEA